MNDVTSVGMGGALVLALLIVGAIALLLWAEARRARSILGKWAEGEGVQIIDFKRAFLIGAFPFWKTSRSQVIFSVRVRDRERREKRGWVRCGNFWGGVFFSNQAEVIWRQS